MRTPRSSWSIAVLLATAPALGAQKRPDVCLDPSSSPASEHREGQQLVAVGSVLHAAWCDWRDGLGDVYYTRSSDGGATWPASALRIDTGSDAGAADARFLSLAASESGVFAAWTDDRDERQRIYFNRSLDGGHTWLPAARPLDDGRAYVCDQPELAAVGSAVYAVWWEWHGPTGSNVFFGRSLDAGGTWGLASALDLGNRVSSLLPSRPRIVATEAAVFVTWADRRFGDWDVFLSCSRDGGTTWWPDEVRLDTGTPRGSSHSLAPALAAQGLEVFVGWADGRDGRDDVYFTRSLDGGLTWLPEEVRLDGATPAGAFASGAPELALSGPDVYAVWCERRSGIDDTYFSRSHDRGATWVRSEQRLSHGTGRARSASLLASGSCVYAVWSERGAGSSYDLCFNRSLDHGASWLADDVRVGGGPPGTTRTGARLACAGPSVYAIWADTRNGFAPDIYFTLVLGAQPYGKGLAGSGGLVPELACAGQASIGGALVVSLARARGGAPAYLALGRAGPAAIPALGGTLLVRPPLKLELLQLSGPKGAAGAGAGALTLPIPTDPSLLGTRFQLQAAVSDPRAPQGYALSAALECWIL